MHRRAARRFSVQCSILLVITACGSTDGAGASAANGTPDRPAVASEGSTLVVEIREGHSENRRLFCVTSSNGGTQRGREDCASVRQAPPEQVSAFDEHREACRRMSDRGVEELRLLGITSEMGGDRRFVVPSPDLSEIAVLTALGRVEQVVDTGRGSQRRDLMSVLDQAMSVYAWSADSRWLAARTSDTIGQVDRDGVVVIDVVRGAIPQDRRLGRYVRSIAWAPGSRQFAVLVSTERLGSGPLESLGKALGHGVPYVDFSLLIVDVASGSECEVVVARQVKYGAGSVMWDPSGVEAQPK